MPITRHPNGNIFDPNNWMQGHSTGDLIPESSFHALTPASHWEHSQRNVKKHLCSRKSADREIARYPLQSSRWTLCGWSTPLLHTLLIPNSYVTVSSNYQLGRLSGVLARDILDDHFTRFTYIGPGLICFIDIRWYGLLIKQEKRPRGSFNFQHPAISPVDLASILIP